MFLEERRDVLRIRGRQNGSSVLGLKEKVVRISHEKLGPKFLPVLGPTWAISILGLVSSFYKDHTAVLTEAYEVLIAAFLGALPVM